MKEKILIEVYEKIEGKGIWIPFSEVDKYCKNCIIRIIVLFNKRF